MEAFLLLFIVIYTEGGAISKTEFLAHTPSDVSDVPRAAVAIHNVNPSAFYRGRSQDLLAGVLGRMLLANSKFPVWSTVTKPGIAINETIEMEAETVLVKMVQFTVKCY